MHNVCIYIIYIYIYILYSQVSTKTRVIWNIDAQDSRAENPHPLPVTALLLDRL